MSIIILPAPWITFYREVRALFGADPEIHMVYDDVERELSLYVENPAKADALARLLPAKREFGNVTMRLTVVHANPPTAGDAPLTLYETAFEGNPAFAYVRRTPGILSFDLVYVVFKRRVVQFFNDSLGDVNGNCSTLYENIARDLFEGRDGVFFCTDTEEIVGVPRAERT